MQISTQVQSKFFKKNHVLLGLAIVIKLFSLDSQLVERYYSTGIYPFFANISRLLLGWLPFSVGDILYVLAGIWALLKFIKITKKLFGRAFWSDVKLNPRYYGYKLMYPFLCFYVVFNLAWGLNYDRLGVTYQLQLNVKNYSKQDLVDINFQLLKRVNTCRSYLDSAKLKSFSNKELFAATKASYQVAEKKYPFLKYQFKCIKPSLYGKLGAYAAFLGYFNPFTGEAQVNTTVPKFGQPFTTCHEVAHQLGYAKEMEANFVAYLVASNSNDSLVRYAVYADLFKYANRALFFADSSLSNQIRMQLLPAVKKDFLEEKMFYRKYSSVLDPALRDFYDIFLKSNGQDLGIYSYDEVTAFLIAFYKKYNYI
jgi:hypothetical protein